MLHALRWRGGMEADRDQQDGREHAKEDKAHGRKHHADFRGSSLVTQV